MKDLRTRLCLKFSDLLGIFLAEASLLSLLRLHLFAFFFFFFFFPIVIFLICHIDDGSSSCCCWANAERAATLLRLHEEFPLKAFGSSSWKLKGIGIDNACRTTIYHLDKLLKKHGRITVKNYGSISDSSSQDLMFSVGSNDFLSSSDENLLKFIILNACIGTFWVSSRSGMN